MWGGGFGARGSALEACLCGFGQVEQPLWAASSISLQQSQCCCENLWCNYTSLRAQWGSHNPGSASLSIGGGTLALGELFAALEEILCAGEDWKGLECGIRHHPRPGPVTHGSGAAADQTKIRGIEAERKHSGRKEKRGRNQKRWRKTKNPTVVWGGEPDFLPHPTLQLSNPRV